MRDLIDETALAEALVAVLGNREVSTADGSMGVDRAAEPIAEAYRRVMRRRAHMKRYGPHDCTGGLPGDLFPF